MSIQTQFDKFHNTIKLGREDEAYKKARERDTSITKAIKLAFSEAGYPIVKDVILGSLATSTAVVPLSGDYDIDRGLVIDEDTAPENPVDPKITAHDVLVNRGFKNSKIKKPCVTADYTSENLHIDFPVFKKNETQYWLAVGKRSSNENNRSWSGSDPMGLIEWVKDSSVHGELASEKQNQLQRLIRYIKRWRDNKFSDSVAAKVFSIGLTVMFKQAFRPSFTSEGSKQDLLALRDTVGAILNGGYFTSCGNDRYSLAVNLPVEPWRDIFDGSSEETATQLRNKMSTLLSKLTEVSEMEDLVKQTTILQGLFGTDFEIPESAKSSSSFTKKARLATSGAVGTPQGA